MLGLLLIMGPKTLTKSEQFSEKNGGKEMFGLLLITGAKKHDKV